MFLANKFSAFAFVLMLTFVMSLPALARDKVGVIDRSGSYIIAPEYSEIRYLEHGFFLCYSLKNDSRAMNMAVDSKITTSQMMNGAVIKDHSGKTISLKIPAGYSLADVYVPKNEFKWPHNSDIRPLDVLPAVYRLKIIGSHGFGATDGSGNITIEPKYAEIVQGDNKPTSSLSMREHGSSQYREVPFEDSPRGAMLNQKVSRDVDVLPQYYFEGLGPFYTKSFRWGYMNAKYDVIIPPKYYEAWAFSEGVAPVRLNPIGEVARVAFIDKSGKVVSPEYWRAYSFRNGKASVALKQGGVERWGVVDRNFKYVVEPHVFVADSDPCSVRDEAGKELFRLPENCLCVYRIPGNSQKEARDTATKRMWNEHPNLVFFDDDGHVQTTISGFDLHENFFQRMAILKESESQSFFEWAKEAKIISDAHRNALIDEDGKWIDKPQLASYKIIFEPDRIIKTVHEIELPFPQ